MLSLLCRRQITSLRRNSVAGWDTNCSTSNAWWRTTTGTTREPTDTELCGRHSKHSQTHASIHSKRLSDILRPKLPVQNQHTLDTHTYRGNILCVKNNDLVFSFIHSDQLCINNCFCFLEETGSRTVSCNHFHSKHCHFFLTDSAGCLRWSANHEDRRAWWERGCLKVTWPSLTCDNTVLSFCGSVCSPDWQLFFVLSLQIRGGTVL